MNDNESKYMYQSILFERVLRHLGYRTANIVNANKEVLLNGVIDKSAEQIIHDYQMQVDEYLTPQEYAEWQDDMATFANDQPPGSGEGEQ